MTTRLEHDTHSAEAAAQWFAELLESNEQREAFFRWIEESPRHVEEFLQVLCVTHQLADLTPERRRAIERLSAELGTDQLSPDNVVALPVQPALMASINPTLTAKPAASPRRWFAHAAGIAAAVALLAVGLIELNGRAQWQAYSTEVGEQRTVALADGSTIHLNTDSMIQVRFSRNAREVHLLRGEALFTVEHESSRPFNVRSLDAQIRAVGTQFDVYQRNGGSRVAVLEGIVRIAREPSISTASPPVPTGPLLHAGEAAELSAEGTVWRRETVDPVSATAWRDGRLIFESDTLEVIAAEFNRYNTVKLRVLGDLATQKRFSGTFDANKPESLVHAFTDYPELRIERIRDEIVIQAPACPGSYGGSNCNGIHNPNGTSPHRSVPRNE